ncbi:MAG: FUSC family protein [Flavobacteriales bacterium]
MNQEQLSKLTDEELLDYAKSIKPSPLLDAFFIGFLIGIIVFGVMVNSWGFFTLVPLYLIYVFLKKPKKYEALQKELKIRGLGSN